ncbi:MAG: hypothetical protein B0W54_04565 [Cellvibrio sp. 79]|nr:MAG: hypothetical protein B0W54_04565 [Cellvibrio sp. 79]
MNIWFFIILILAISLILGPIAMLKPKPAQKRKEALRHYAQGKGLRFTLRKLPKLKTDIEEPGVCPVYYLAPTAQMQGLPTWVLVRTQYEHDGNFYREWDWYNEHRPGQAVSEKLRDYLPQLPDSVNVITQGEAGTSVFWSEKEDEGMVDLIVQMLGDLQVTASAEPSM